jgi:triacylglycerol lipase
MGESLKVGYSSVFINTSKQIEESFCETYRYIANGELVDLIRRVAAACARIFTEFCVYAFVWATRRQLVLRPLPESACVLAHAAINFVDLQNIEPTTLADLDVRQPAVFLVHGYMGSNSGWAAVYDRLRKEGVHNIFTVNLGHPLHSIEEYTDTLREKIQSVQRTFRGQGDPIKIVLIGHSMGGLVCRRYRQMFAAKDEVPVLSIATVGTPLSGTPVARLVSSIAPAPREMLPGSPFIQAQQSWKDEEDTTTYMHIGSNGDLVVPEEFALDGHEQHMRSIRVPDTGHIGLLLFDKVGDELVQFVRESYNSR